MSKQKPSSLFFTDGCVTSADTVVIPAQLNKYPKHDMSRVCLVFGDVWRNYDVPKDMIRSVSFSNTDSICYMLGKNGTVISCGGNGKPFTQQNIAGTFRTAGIDDAKRYGELFRLRVVAGVPYACGQYGQVYRGSAGGPWVHADDGLLGKKAETLEDIDGTSTGNLYAVGWAGTVMHFDGQGWHSVDVGTNQILSNVRCLPSGEVLICGNSGILIRSVGAGWEQVTNPLGEPNYYGMDVFGGRIYLAYPTGMHVFDGSNFAEVDFGLGRKVTCHRLHSNDGVLWSFGVDDLLRFDGQQWREVICPDNL
jgi:hypothetical protein